MPINHDQNFKNLILDYPRQALAFFAAEAVKRIDPDAEVIPIRQERLKNRLSDRFFELDVPLRVTWGDGREDVMLFVLEEESDPRRYSIYRLGVYCLQLAEEFDTDRVVPVVIFLKCRPEPRTSVALGGDRVVLSFEPFIFMLGNLCSAEYLESTNIVARIALPCMRHESSEGQCHARGKAVQGLTTYERDPEKILKYYEFIQHYSHLDETAQRLYAEYYAKEEEQMSSYVEQIRAEGRQQGLQQGLQQGEQQLLLKQLRVRFGALDDGVAQRLKDASVEELDRWAANILTARSLDDVFQV
ncbi:MAG: DUF4351 domain-containing protein [Lautropia sp.]|nr:DUF4351 domain-containing protein [Lautropia sp.]